jgi:SPP1 family phage portal protein
MEQTYKTLEEKLSAIPKVYARYNEKRYAELKEQWDYSRHEVMSEAHRPDDKVMVKDEETDVNGRRTGAVYETKKVHRISSSLEQLIVDIHTAFAVGLPPDLHAVAKTKEQEYMLDLIRETETKNKIRFINQRAVRAVLSETIVAEYWWAVKDPEFYEDKDYARGADTRLRCELWSPFNGDRIVPIKDTYGDLVSFYRFYSVKVDDKEVEKLMEIDASHVYTYENVKGKGWTLISQELHGFDKMPVIYMEMKHALCDRIQSKRKRIEELESNYADCINDNFFPKVLLRGNVSGVQKSGKTQTIQMTGNEADVRYLTWDQSTSAAESELARLEDACYTMTMTPRINPKDLQGLGTALSGVAFKYVFMGAHIAVRKHEEVIGEYLARRYSFLKHAISLQVPAVRAGRSLRLDPAIVPFTIEASTEGEKSEDEKPKE